MRVLLILIFLLSCSTAPAKRSAIEQYRQYRTIEELKRYLDSCPPEEKSVGLELALEIAPKDLGVRERYARYLMEQGVFDTASEMLVQIIKEDPSYFTAYLNLATLALKQGRVEEARSLCSRGKAIAPADARFRRCLALIGGHFSSEGLKQGILSRLRISSPL